MAARYWVGGTAAWDGTAGTKWATIDGGTGGAAVPTTADDVYFTAASGAVTVTVATVTANCASLNFTGFTGTLAGTTQINVYGNLIAASGMTWTHSGTIVFASSTTQQVTCNGKTISPIQLTGTATPTVSLQDAFSSSSAITISGGIFTTNNYAVTASSLSSSNSNTRAINLGSSTVTLSSTPAIDFTTSTGLTFNAGTSQINCSYAATGSFTGGSQTFYNVAFTATNSSSPFAIRGANTFNNLTLTASNSVSVREFTFNSPNTINGTLSTTNTAGNRRIWLHSENYGIAQTLTINSAPILTDADFRDIYVIGTATPISGTRIGDLRGCLGITFSTPKTVYWNLAGNQNWSANGWAATSTGAPSTDYFPLAQDTATFTNAGSVTGTITFDAAIPYVGTVDTSARAAAMTFAGSTAYTMYGDWKGGTGAGLGFTAAFTFSGRNTQTITSSGKTFSCNITVDSYGGTVQLADALSIGTNTLTVTNGTFSTQGYNVTAGSLSSSNSNVRAINLGASTVTTSGSASFINFSTSTNLTFNCGTSTITNSNATSTFAGGGNTFYNLSFLGAAVGYTNTVSGSNTFNNLTFNISGGIAGVYTKSFSADQTINGTLTCTGSDAVHRIFFQSSALGTNRTITVNSLSADDCDFRDITIAGTAAGTSPTRAGDCGGNSGITFPAPKTVYWNLAGAQNWSSTGWATSSGGTPAVNNFPLAQDTAVLDNSSSVTQLGFDYAWNVGTFDSSLRTNACSVPTGSGATIYGDWKTGTGITIAASGFGFTFSKRGTQTITSNGVSFSSPITIDCYTGTVQLADALTNNSTRTLTLTSGTFDAVSYNVTTGLVSCASGTTLKMGSGTWTLSGTGTVWACAGTLYKGTANIVLSDTSTSARTFAGSGLSYNKLTIGGTTGISTLTISGTPNQFTELASTKTVAHTIALGTTSPIFGKWSVTGSAGNVVTVTGTATISIAGAAVSGVDYLALGTTVLSTTSPAEFFAGANSTGGTNFTLTAAPAPRTLYWVGGTGNWSSTTKWSTASGGASGAAIPTSLDAVNFDSASNATAYTATIDPTQARCASLTIAGPASGNVTIAGTGGLACHGNTTFAASGITRTYSGTITLTGSGSNTLTTNGLVFASPLTVNGVSCTWILGSALNFGAQFFTLTNGTFDTAGYSATIGSITASNSNTRGLYLGNSTITIPSTGTNIAFTISTNLTLDAGTSTINYGNTSPNFNGGGNIFYNVNFTNTAIGTASITGSNTFNDLSVAGRVSAGVSLVNLSANQTINGTLTLSAGTNATMRTFVQSDTLGTQRTLTCNAVAALTDIDFRDIVIAGAAAPVLGTRLGDCKGNSGITFDAPKTVYCTAVTNGNWGSNIWNNLPNGLASLSYFPLAQDTVVFSGSPTPYPSSGNTITINFNYNIGTIDMSARTSNTMTLATSSTTPTIYGNWVNGTGVTLTGTGAMTFAGRGSQAITCAGSTFTQPITINTPSGSVTLQDAFTTSLNGAATVQFNRGTFNANGYNVTLTGASSAIQTSGTTDPRTVAIGSGTWTVAGTGGWAATTPTNLTVTGTGTISLTSASAKTFAGGGLSYSGITLNQGGAGALTITGNNTFYNITNTYSGTGAANINIGTTTQTVSNFTATGASGKVLTVQGTSASSPGTLILTSGTVSTPDYLSILGVRAYSLATTWYAGANSTNLGSLGWIFAASTPTGVYKVYYGSTNIHSIYYGSTPVKVYYGSLKVFG